MDLLIRLVGYPVCHSFCKVEQVVAPTGEGIVLLRAAVTGTNESMGPGRLQARLSVAMTQSDCRLQSAAEAE